MKKNVSFLSPSVLCGGCNEKSENLPETLQQKLDKTQHHIYGDYRLNEPIGIALFLKSGDEELFLTTSMLKTLSPDDHFRIGAITQSFYDTAAYQLIEAGKLDMELSYKFDLTVRELLTGNAPEHTYLAELVEKYAEQPHEEYIREHILLPNGLTETSIPQADDDKLPEPALSSYYLVPTNGRYFISDQKNPQNLMGSGNMISNFRDLATWAKLAKSTTLKPEYHNLSADAATGYITIANYNQASDIAWVIVTNHFDPKNTLRQYKFLMELDQNIEELVK